jgi:3',5'-cyclic AMP phosphodiesterase CpdA
MRIAQISDFHFTHSTWNPLRLLSKRLLGHVNWLLTRKGHFFEEQLLSLPALFDQLGVDLVLLGGDFSTTALKEEFEKAGKFIRQIRQPWIAIPGNHDHYTWRSYRQKHFYHYFANARKEITHPVEFFTLKEQGVEAHKIGPGWWVVALDTALATHPYSSEGLLSEKLEAYLEEVIRLIPANDSILLFNHYPFFQNDAPRRNLRRGDALQRFLERHPRIRLYLHGHTHRQTVADLQVSSLPLVLDSGSCAQGQKGTWHLLDLDAKGCTVSTYQWNQSWQPARTETFAWTR